MSKTVRWFATATETSQKLAVVTRIQLYTKPHTCNRKFNLRLLKNTFALDNSPSTEKQKMWVMSLRTYPSISFAWLRCWFNAFTSNSHAVVRSNTEQSHKLWTQFLLHETGVKNHNLYIDNDMIHLCYCVFPGIRFVGRNLYVHVYTWTIQFNHMCIHHHR